MHPKNTFKLMIATMALIQSSNYMAMGPFQTTSQTSLEQCLNENCAKAIKNMTRFCRRPPLPKYTLAPISPTPAATTVAPTPATTTAAPTPVATTAAPTPATTAPTPATTAPTPVATTVAPSITEDALFAKGEIHTGEATYYGGGYTGGCAMLDPVSTDYYITALNIFDYDNALLAGAYLQVTGESGTINVLVTDLLPEGKKGDLDLNELAFPLIAPKEKGRVNVSWKIIPFPTNEPIRYKFKEGSSQYWCGIQVRNHVYPVAKLEYKNKEGQFVELPRRHYNYFESTDLGAGPYTFRVTDIYGDVLIDENIPFSLDTEVPGAANFPE